MYLGFTKYYLIPLSYIFLQFNAENEQSQESLGPFQPKKLDIYLLIGQSNMAGRANIESADSDSLENVFLFCGSEEKIWEKAANPLNKYSSIRKGLSMQKLGPGYAFALEMAKSSKGKQIGLVVNAKGGTNIDEWAPGTEFYKEATSRTKSALKNGTLKGILWHQGEANSADFEKYMSKVTTLIESLRSDFGIPDLPFVAGQLSEDKALRIPFNHMIVRLPNNVANSGVVSASGTSTFDSTHFDSASQRLLGQRYAQKMVEIQKKIKILNNEEIRR